MNTFTKKLISLLVTASLVVSLFQPMVVRAQDVIGGPSQVISTLTDVKESLKVFGLDKIAMRIASDLLNSMVDSITNWVNTGFDGEPLFVTNPGDFFGNVALTSATMFVDDIKGIGFKYSPQKLARIADRATNECIATPTNTVICQCGTQATARLEEMYRIEAYSPEERQLFMQRKAAEGYPTLETYIDEKYPITDCREIESQMGLSGFTQMGGYSNQVIKFLGYSYDITKNKSAETLLPSLTKDVSQNWVQFQTDFSQGGWNAWDQAVDMRNNPFGSVLIASGELNAQISGQVTQYTQQLQQNGGFLNMTRCKAGGKVSLSDQRTVCPQGNQEVVTPGTLISEQLAQAMGTSIKKTSEIDSWGQVLSNALFRMTSNLINVGLNKANNEIGRQLALASGQYSGLGGNIIAQNEVANGSAEASRAEEIVDIDGFLYGDYVQKQKRNANGSLQYEAVVDPITGQPRLNRLGQPIYDITRPVYEYTQALDTNGNPIPGSQEPVYEPEFMPLCVPMAQAAMSSICIPQIDTATGEYVRDTTRPKMNPDGTRAYRRANGAIARTRRMVNILEAQKTALNQIPKEMYGLDRCLPGPDLNWEERLQSVYDSASETDDAGVRAALKEIGIAAYNVIDDYMNNVEQPKARCMPGGSTQQSIYVLNGLRNENNHLNCDPTDPNNYMNTAQNLGSTTNAYNIPSFGSSLSLLKSIKTKYSSRTKQIKDTSDQMKSVLQTLTTIESDYNAYLNNATVVGGPSVNEIARSVVAIREDVPFDPTIDREKLALSDIQQSITQLIAAQNTCKTEIAQPQNLQFLLKDKLKILYCPFQYHGRFNQKTDNEKIQEVANLGLSDTNDEAALIAAIAWNPVAAALHFSNAFGTNNNPYRQLFAHPSPNNGGQVQGHEAEFMCWSTNQINGERLGDGSKQCYGQGKTGNGPDANRRIERLKINCREFYSADTSSYYKALGLDNF